MDALLPEPDELEPFRRVVEQIYMLMQNAGVFGARHPTTIASAERLCAVLREAQPPYALQFVRD
ncbi:MAG TPA: hypothetical protein VHM19_15495, partial [Polyangiales bacterium]|nr:hypothetical protein [Polyangiales bacterium]